MGLVHQKGSREARGKIPDHHACLPPIHFLYMTTTQLELEIQKTARSTSMSLQSAERANVSLTPLFWVVYNQRQHLRNATS